MTNGHAAHSLFVTRLRPGRYSHVPNSSACITRCAGRVHTFLSRRLLVDGSLYCWQQQEGVPRGSALPYCIARTTAFKPSACIRIAWQLAVWQDSTSIINCIEHVWHEHVFEQGVRCMISA